MNLKHRSQGTGVGLNTVYYLTVKHRSGSHSKMPMIFRAPHANNVGKSRRQCIDAVRVKRDVCYENSFEKNEKKMFAFCIFKIYGRKLHLYICQKKTFMLI